jgi:hypothetical protein
MKKLLGAHDAQILFADRFGSMFACYFLFGKKDLALHKIEYAANFVPAFLSGLKKSKSKKCVRKIILIAACKGFSLPIKVYSGILQNIKKVNWIYKICKKYFY